jgi:hypothetical protein
MRPSTAGPNPADRASSGPPAAGADHGGSPSTGPVRGAARGPRHAVANSIGGVGALLDLRTLSPLTGVGDGPQRAARELAALGLPGRLATYDPVCVSSLLTGLGVERSDLDVVCDLREPGFVAAATAAYGDRPGFATWEADADRTIVAFDGDELRVELVGEPKRVEAQAAYRHAVAHRRLVQAGGPALATRVRELRTRRGWKTEPALSAVLELDGDPFTALAALAVAPDARIARLVDGV